MSERRLLSREAEVYDAHVEEWRRTHLGEVVLIKDGEVLGFFRTLEQAFKEGTERFGLEPFFVKQVVPRDVVNISLVGKRIRAA